MNKEVAKYSRKIYETLVLDVPKNLRRDVVRRVMFMLDCVPALQGEETMDFLMRKAIFGKNSFAARSLARKCPTVRHIALLSDKKELLSIRNIGPVTLKRIYEALHEDGLMPNWQP